MKYIVTTDSEETALVLNVAHVIYFSALPEGQTFVQFTEREQLTLSEPLQVILEKIKELNNEIKTEIADEFSPEVTKGIVK